jgi:hypothetical protein
MDVVIIKRALESRLSAQFNKAAENGPAQT